MKTSSCWIQSARFLLLIFLVLDDVMIRCSQKSNSYYILYLVNLTIYPDGDAELSFPDLHATTHAACEQAVTGQAPDFLGIELV